MTYKVYRFNLEQLKRMVICYGVKINSNFFNNLECFYAIKLRKNTKRWDIQFGEASKFTDRIFFGIYPEDVLCDINEDVICYEREDDIYEFYVEA